MAAPMWADDSSDDELPSLERLLGQTRGAPPSQSRKASQSSIRLPPSKSKSAPEPQETLKPKQSSETSPPTEKLVRRRKLGQQSENPLLRPLGQDVAASAKGSGLRTARLDLKEPEKSSGLRVELRARKPKAVEPEAELDESQDLETVIEDVTMMDDSVYFSFSDPESDSASDGIDSDDAPKTRPKPSSFGGRRSRSHLTGTEDRVSKQPSKDAISKPMGQKWRVQTTAEDPRPGREASRLHDSDGGKNVKKPSKHAQAKAKGQVQSAGDYLAGSLSKLKLEPEVSSRSQAGEISGSERPSTPPPPPNTPPKSRPKGLVSPTKKLPRIPMTPHGPTADAFWSQEFVDNWNETHSPRKLFQPDPAKSPVKASPTKKEQAAQRQAKKSFEAGKHESAKQFLDELDQVITGGQLGKLAESTGGIKLQWTKTLNTTAGRANWRRETIRRRHATAGAAGAGGEAAAAAVTTEQRHHAAIELAEKVIDSEDRLLNVLAHEFCHLATFMITGVTTNPHGREFKAWAAKCSRALAHRGVNVTTKHSYEIDFKFVWECAECAGEYKRHSRSINPQRHRCGVCRGELRQTKPVPRAAAPDAEGKTKKKEPTEYQLFMKEHMKSIREENPGSPQKEIMKQVAERWAKQKKPKTRAAAKGSSAAGGGGGGDVEEATEGLVGLSLD